MSQRFALFLRGLNVGKRRITSDALIAAVRTLGFDDVSAYQASGNLVVGSDQSADEVRGAVERGLAPLLGYDVPVFVRSRTELEALVKRTPFAGRPRASTVQRTGKVQVIFLQGPLSPSNVSKLAALDSDDDWLEARGREIFWWPRLGVSGSELQFATLDRVPGGTTVRTFGTIERLSAKFF